jgi:pimeloyl-ACP methyl ester carboxylesterase
VVAAANPLRSLAADATSVSDVVRSVNGPVLLVGHSYGGAVISNVPSDAGEIIGLVYLCAFAPEGGESCNSLARLFPGSTLCEALEPIRHSDRTTDLYISLDRFHDQFCADLPARLAATQRPVTLQALEERSGHRPLWKELPSWFLVGGRDRNTPAAGSATWPSVPTHTAPSSFRTPRTRSPSPPRRRPAT